MALQEPALINNPAGRFVVHANSSKEAELLQRCYRAMTPFSTGLFNCRPGSYTWRMPHWMWTLARKGSGAALVSRCTAVSTPAGG